MPATSIIQSWRPVTHDFGLIRAPVAQVVAALTSWHHSINHSYQPPERVVGLREAFSRLLPLCHAKQRRLFLATRSEWTACYQNGIQGSDPFPAMSFLARELKTLAMRVCITPPGAVWPGVIWEVYAPPELGDSSPLGYRRSVGASNDGGRWVFDESGAPFDFERTELYRAPRKRDRFPPELLLEYLVHFGIRPFDDDFFVADTASPAILLRRVQEDCGMPEFALQEVIDGKPWEYPVRH